MNKQKLRELAEKAKEATNGLPTQVLMIRPKEVGGTCYLIRGHCENGIAIIRSDYWGDSHNPPTDDYGYLQPDDVIDCHQSKIDLAYFMASANPATILALLDENAALLEALRDLRDFYEELTNLPACKANSAIAKAESS